MKGIFDYDSKFTQALLKFADIIILNALYLLFSLPIVTIGAAQAGLYTGFRVMIDPEDDSSCAAAFLRGFKNGFTIITPVWLILSGVVFFAGWSLISTYIIELMGDFAPTIISIIVLVVAIIFQTLAPIFHSRFSCTRRQLVKNVWYLFLAHPLRCTISVALMWAPLILFLLDAYLFMQTIMITVTVWYGFAGLIAVTLMRKPFKSLEEQFYANQDESGDTTDASEEAETSPAQLESKEAEE